MASSFIIQKGPGIASKAYNYAKKLFKGDKQKTTGTEVISKINPNVPKNPLEKAQRDLRLQKMKTAGSQSKLDTTRFEIKQGQKDLTFDYMKKDVPRNKKLKVVE